MIVNDVIITVYHNIMRKLLSISLGLTPDFYGKLVLIRGRNFKIVIINLSF